MDASLYRIRFSSYENVIVYKRREQDVTIKTLLVLRKGIDLSYRYKCIIF